MAVTKSLFRFTLYTLMALILLCLGAYLWLRYEFAIVEDTETDPRRWDAVEVTALGTGLPDPLPCAAQYPTRKAWFGGLHVHTEASYDAAAFGTLTNVDQAYAFATGKPIPMRLRDDPADAAVPVLQITSPLDFMAVTDHAEKLGERRLCYMPDNAAYDALSCRLYRGDIELPVDDRFAGLVRLMSFAAYGESRSQRVCGDDGQRCLDMAVNVWERNQRSTEAWQDRSSDCRFTTFHAYEYTMAKDASNLHRNVIFRTATVPQQPLSASESPTPEGLWTWLDNTCISGHPDCDALAIPHNSNWSSGRMWYPYSRRELPTQEQVSLARLRERVEPLVEIMQVKGDSECRNGIASVMGEPDELCNFEKLRPVSEPINDCGETMGSGGMMLRGCMSRYSFVRYALTAGLAEKKALGVNPFRMGIVAASDTHVGAPMVGREKNHPGSHGNDRDIQARLLGKIEMPGNVAAGSPVRYNPGGIAGVYAVENSREALFNAMRNRETFGTSGPRIEPRFFAGADYPADLCQQTDYLEQAYAGGVPMGGVLGTSAAGESPVFVASAHQDPRGGANLLQRVQVIKGWIDGEGATHQAVYDIAGAAPGEATVDKATCAVSGRGFAQLCATWRDPDFDPAVPAVYYARVIENPSCRWSHYDCLSLPEEERPPACSDPDLPWQIQERAWTSPIWYEPDA